MTMATVRKYRKNLLVLDDGMMVLYVFSIVYQVFFLCYCMISNPLYDLETLYPYILSVGIMAEIYYKNKDEYHINKKTVSKYIR